MSFREGQDHTDYMDSCFAVSQAATPARESAFSSFCRMRSLKRIRRKHSLQILRRKAASMSAKLGCCLRRYQGAYPRVNVRRQPVLRVAAGSGTLSLMTGLAPSGVRPVSEFETEAATAFRDSTMERVGDYRGSNGREAL